MSAYTCKRSGQRLGALALTIVLAAGGPGEATPAKLAPASIVESYKLPISPPRDQGDSDLCWVYATLSMLESNFLQKHPHSKIDLSRAALQRASIADRLRRWIAGQPAHLEDGGLAVDAIALIRRDGLVGARDFHDIVDPDPVFAAASDVLASSPGLFAKLSALHDALTRWLGPPPSMTRLDGRTLTPAQLAAEVLGDAIWTEYDVTDGPAHVGRSDDPDARPETRVHFVSLAEAVGLIRKSLAHGQAVVWGSTDNHALLIYGADYDAAGEPTAYWVKDSFAPYTYRAAAADVHRVLTDVTVAAPMQAPVASREGRAASASN